MPCKTAVARTPLGSKFSAESGLCLVIVFFQVTIVYGRGSWAAMTKLGILAATIPAAAGACCAVEARADAKTRTGLRGDFKGGCAREPVRGG